MSRADLRRAFKSSRFFSPNRSGLRYREWITAQQEQQKARAFTFRAVSLLALALLVMSPHAVLLWISLDHIKSIGIAPIQIFEVDNVAQTGHVHKMGMVFKQGDIASCAVPVIAGSALDTSSYQCDVKTRWPDGSLQRAVISFIASLTALQALQVSFQSGACNNAGYLDKAAMIAFNSGNWNGQILVTANSQTYTWDAKAMLTALSIGAGQIEYWQQGPVVTTVRVWDVTAAFTYFRGWHWDGATMADCSGSICDTTSTFASLQGYFDLRFIPSKGIVEMDIITENQSTNRGQDQVYDLEIKTDNGSGTLVSRYTKSAFTHIFATDWKKSYTSGTAQGHTRIDWNFPYLISTKLFPNYDQRPLVTTKVNPATEYTAFIGSDMGDLGGSALMDKGYSGNNEGALEQIETLRYLYLMGTANTLAAAKAWDILTGEVDTQAGLTGVSGGAGYFNILMNVPFHYREARTSGGTTFYYCAGYDSPNATPATACAGSETPLGKQLSRDFVSTGKADGTAAPPVPFVGTATLGGWSAFFGDHWLDYSYVPAMLLGDRWHLEQLYDAGHFLVANVDSYDAFAVTNGMYGYALAGNVVYRTFVWTTQVLGKAIVAAPTGSPQKTYLLAKLNSNLGMQEGFMGITGTTLTPTSPVTNCAGYDQATARRWEFGRCSPQIGQNIATAMHATNHGGCPADIGDAGAYVDPTKATDYVNMYFNSFAQVGGGDLVDKGFTQAAPIFTETSKLLVERLLDPTFIPYLVATEAAGLRNGVGSCPASEFTTNAYFTTHAQVKDTYLSSVIASATSFTAVTGNFICDDHGYSILAYAASTFAKAFGVSSGLYTGALAFAFMDANQPYFVSPCTTDAQLKFALQPRGGLTGISGIGGTSGVGGKVVIQ